MIHKPTSDKLYEFENIMIGGIIALGGSECDRCGYDWELTTLYGKLRVNIVPSLFGIHTIFETKPDVDVLGGVRIDPLSGKWNNHRTRAGTPRIAAAKLIDELRRVVFGDYVPSKPKYQPRRGGFGIAAARVDPQLEEDFT